MSFLEFHEIPFDTRVTKVWLVQSRTGAMLGYIRWLAPWRKYTYHPIEKTLYDPNCLRELADFCESETTKHKTKPKPDPAR